MPPAAVSCTGVAGRRRDAKATHNTGWAGSTGGAARTGQCRGSGAANPDNRGGVAARQPPASTTGRTRTILANPEDRGCRLNRSGSSREGRRGKAKDRDCPNPEGGEGGEDLGVVLCLFVPAPEDMPKLKSRKAAAKRFKATGSGKFLRRRAFRSHLLDHKSPKRKRYLGTMAVVDERDADNVSAMLPYA